MDVKSVTDGTAAAAAGQSPVLYRTNTKTDYNCDSNCEILYFHFHEAFDKVNHSGLFIKLQKLGINGKF